MWKSALPPLWSGCHMPHFPCAPVWSLVKMRFLEILLANINCFEFVFHSCSKHIRNIQVQSPCSTVLEPQVPNSWTTSKAPSDNNIPLCQSHWGTNAVIRKRQRTTQNWWVQERLDNDQTFQNSPTWRGKYVQVLDPFQLHNTAPSNEKLVWRPAFQCAQLNPWLPPIWR